MGEGCTADASSSLEAYRVGTLPSLFVLPDFISEALETQLLSNITASKAKWQKVKGRCLQEWGGTLSKRGALIPAPFPSWLQAVVDSVSRATGIYGDRPANHVLVNKYEPGEGILPHEDGPCYCPAVAILSVGAPTVMRFVAKRTDDPQDGGGRVVASVLLPPRSLLVFKDEAYTECLHGIDAVAEDVLAGDTTVVNPDAAGGAGVLQRTGVRISLTVRRVPKTLGVGILAGRH